MFFTQRSHEEARSTASNDRKEAQAKVEDEGTKRRKRRKKEEKREQNGNVERKKKERLTP
jgi:hypothetical protein